MTTLTAAPPELATGLPPHPYPGLRPFEPDEWPIFFGRERMCDEVIARLAAQHLVVVHGASGSGKSSLVRAGVLPWLDLDHARSGKGWAAALMRPSGGPLRNLARELAGQLGPPPGAEADAATAWHDRLPSAAPSSPTSSRLLRPGRRQPLRPDRPVRGAVPLRPRAQPRGGGAARRPPLRPRRPDERPAPHLFVILTMRSDYLGACARFEGFAEAVNRCQYLLPRMDDFALLRAIHEPATLYGGTVESAVGDRLLFAARETEDALPVLQHTLMRAADHARARDGRERWTVTLDDLQAVEGRAGRPLPARRGGPGRGHRRRPGPAQGGRVAVPQPHRPRRRGRVIRRPTRLGDLVAVAGGEPARPAVLAVSRPSARPAAASSPPTRRRS